jgi:hypothetical protein
MKIPKILAMTFSFLTSAMAWEGHISQFTCLDVKSKFTGELSLVQNGHSQYATYSFENSNEEFELPRINYNNDEIVTYTDAGTELNSIYLYVPRSAGKKDGPEEFEVKLEKTQGSYVFWTVDLKCTVKEEK